MAPSVFDPFYEPRDTSSYRTREQCLQAMWNRSEELKNLPHCDPDWDPYVHHCWAPTLAGHDVKLPCPDYEYINHRNFAFRRCLPNATWYVNYTFDDKPYTNFHECYIPHDKTLFEKLVHSFRRPQLLIWEELSEGGVLRDVLQGLSIAFLFIALLIWILLWIKSKRAEPRHVTFVLGIVAMLMNHITTVSMDPMNDLPQITGCRISKFLVGFSDVLFSFCLLGHVVQITAVPLRIKIKRLPFNFSIVVFLSLSFVLAVIEMILEVTHNLHSFCLFGVFQSSFHWLTTGSSLFILSCVLCIDFVSIFGLFYLNYPDLARTRNYQLARLGALTMLVVSVYNFVCDVHIIFIHTMPYLNLSRHALVLNTRTYAACSAARGLVFALVLCLLDLDIIVMLLPTHLTVCLWDSEIQEEKMNANVTEDDDVDATIYDDENNDETRQMRVLVRLEKAEDVEGEMAKIFESKLVFGPLRSST